MRTACEKRITASLLAILNPSSIPLASMSSEIPRPFEGRYPWLARVLSPGHGPRAIRQSVSILKCLNIFPDGATGLTYHR